MRVSSLSILKRTVFLPAIELLVGIDANVELVVQQVVVGAIAAVLAAQDVGARRRAQRRRRLALAAPALLVVRSGRASERRGEATGQHDSRRGASNAWSAIIRDVPPDCAARSMPSSTRFVQALDRHRAAVLTAAPGAGKTTRVPPAWSTRAACCCCSRAGGGARHGAPHRRRARLDARDGRSAGTSASTGRRPPRPALLVVTEGILTAYLQDDPLLSDVTTLIVDEFHERSIHADLGLALARQAWLARTRPAHPGDVGDAGHGARVADSSAIAR